MKFTSRLLLIVVLVASASGQNKASSASAIQQLQEIATVTRVGPFKAATSGKTGFIAVLVTDGKVTYVVQARSLAELHSIKQGDRVGVRRRDWELYLTPTSRDKAFSLPLIRIDPCPPEMLHGDGTCVIRGPYSR